MGSVFKRSCRRSLTSAGHLLVIGLFAVAAVALPAGADDTVITITDKTIYEITSDYGWGYSCGLKQPLGAYKNGLSVHQITKSNFPENTNGHPDYLLWVNETDGSYGVSRRPTRALRPVDDGGANYKNPGGMVGFAADGTIWYTYGARAHDLPLDLYRSTSPYAVDDFSMELDDYVTSLGSSTPCLNVHDPKLMLFWREGGSTQSSTTVRFRRYDMARGLASYEAQADVGAGVEHPALGTVGIEQLSSRFDPRFGYTFVTWQWFAVGDYRFGSYPFLYSDDDGETWRTAPGTPRNDLPLDYSEIDSVVVPYDHIAQGNTTSVQLGELGVSPNGTFWMAAPIGNCMRENQWVVYFWLWNGARWRSRGMTGGMLAGTKPYACGVTEDYVVLVYSDNRARNALYARVSEDDGWTWSEPIELDALPSSQAITWVSFAQPADDYADNSARFFYAYYNWSDGMDGRRYRNNIRWIRIDIERRLIGDFNHDCAVDYEDFSIIYAAYGSREGDPNWNEACDLDLDGRVNFSDFTIFSTTWGTSC